MKFVQKRMTHFESHAEVNRLVLINALEMYAPELYGGVVPRVKFRFRYIHNLQDPESMSLNSKIV